jgi:hypothetical protein
MGKEQWIVQFLRWGLYFAGGLAIAIDASASYNWFYNATGLEGWAVTAITVVLATVCSSFGTLLLSPGSWVKVLRYTRSVASIRDTQDRLAVTFGYALSAVAILIAMAAVYWLDIISTLNQTGTLSSALLIVFASDVCFMLAAWFSELTKKTSSPHPSPRQDNVIPMAGGKQSRFKAQ